MSKKIVVFSTHDFGGAGESAVRISHALQYLGNEVILLVKQKTKNDKFILQINKKPASVEPIASRIAKKIHSKVSSQINKVTKNNIIAPELQTEPKFCFFNVDEAISLFNTNVLIEHMPFKPDMILVCWVSGFINTQNMSELHQKFSVPLYWLTMDMAPITGGCHYAWDCNGYTQDCNDCPAITTRELKQVARQNLEIKKKNIGSGSIQVLAHSKWCFEQASNSSLFKNQKNILLINGFVDQNLFNNSCRTVAKQIFGIRSDKKIIFSGSTFTNEERKGIRYFVEALQLIYERIGSEQRDAIQVMVAGNYVLENKLVKQIPFKVVPIDYIKDDRLLSLAYQAADVFVCPSIEDAGPMMVPEALACGTPVVGFNLGFVSDIVEHGINGFRVPMKDTKLLSNYIYEIISFSDDTFKMFSDQAVEAANKNFSLNNFQEFINKVFDISSR